MRTQMQITAKASQNPSLKQAKAGLLQRRCACGQHAISGDWDEDRKNKGILQRAAANPMPNTMPHAVHEVLESPGQPLGLSTRTFMERRFGQDFSKVRVHADPKAAESAKSMNALAYTVGRDIVFDSGQYTPATFQGIRLLSHELTHVIQQGQTTNHTSPLTLGMDYLEHSADSVSRRILSREPIIVHGTSGPAISRQPRSLNQTLDPTLMSDEKIALEINAIRQWLRQNQSSSVENNQLAAVLGRMGQELIRRHPQIQPKSAGRAGTPAPLIGLVSAASIAQAEVAIASAPAVAIPAAAPAIPAAAPAVAPGAGTIGGVGIGAALAAVAAFLVVLLWPSSIAPEPRVQPQTQTRTRPRTETQTRPRGEAERAGPRRTGGDDCNEMMVACMLTSLADEPGSVFGQSRCLFCAEVCRRDGGVWPSQAPTTGVPVRCDFWNFQ